MPTNDALDTKDVVIEDCALTTVDNPYNPFTHWDQWYSYDEAKGYHTCGLLARFTITSHEISEIDQDLAIQTAINEIVELNPLGIHRKIFRNN